ncbi:hypothetical protein GUJ93_ZPchr0012g21850 [Zizania palustris]|uniref:Uncharacterized protein n=1 Tax=Zizania palustris TaxID=103762 RepID=A0A8J5WPI0_ZIZPA|nr:hypothetical protein GUJ93_ZPchr0012g21850 [Zizania palustris]
MWRGEAEGKIDESEEIEAIPNLLETKDQEFEEVVEQSANNNSEEEDEAEDVNNNNEEEYTVIPNEWQAQDFDVLAVTKRRDTRWEYGQNEVQKDAVYPMKDAVQDAVKAWALSL